MTEFKRIAEYIANQPPEGWPYRLLTESAGLAYRHSLQEVVAIVVSQLIEGRTVVVMPPIRPDGTQDGAKGTPGV